MSYFFSTMREASRTAFHRPLAFFGSVLTVFLAMLIAGSIAVIIKNSSIALDKLKAEATVEVYLNPQLDSLGTKQLRVAIMANKYVLDAKHINKETALYRLRETFGPEMVAGLKTNPLPESFEISLDPDVYDGDNFAALVETLRQLPGIDDIGYVPTIISRFKMLFKLISIAGLALGLLVALATGYIVSNTIQVKVAERNQTFYIMRLVGAGPNFIRSPYLFIGCMIGFLGATSAIVCVKLAQLYFSGILMELSFLSPVETVCFILAGGVLGLLGSNLALKRYIKA